MIAIALHFYYYSIQGKCKQHLLYVKFLSIIHSDSPIHDFTHLTYFRELLKRKLKDKKDRINIISTGKTK